MNKMLEGVEVRQLKKLPDERGFFTEIMRKDWAGLFREDEIVQANLSITFPNIIRAWHRHVRGQVDYFVVLRGTIKICVLDEKNNDLMEIISTGDVPQMVRVPGEYWHGFKAVGNEPAWLLYFVNKLYDYEDPD